MVILSLRLWDGIVRSRVGPLVGRVRAVLACTYPTGHPGENRPVQTARVAFSENARMFRITKRMLNIPAVVLGGVHV
ncbi:hypothetical protein CDL15_Pgr006405 [Punica granatum]|uniref:Uncharacterized protein n=1 Tax=Punica granatum TaxID=22663 RepID=A0A218VU61_PUNGR|nr:hypothetical protein CDL15_Pgr006405 [Punica granatum]